MGVLVGVGLCWEGVGVGVGDVLMVGGCYGGAGVSGGVGRALLGYGRLRQVT